ncbi:roadblock/LC7 domain-containing protein [Streptomyces sp. DT195]|uniref:roadblock/LC7 domain-containing protein n=1 Tax=Streptomyces sp. DT195 TaxID=3393419 RepID=UPI003CE77BA1
MNSSGAMTTTPSAGDTSNPLEGLGWLLTQFVSDNPGVTHGVLMSRDGLKLLDSGVDRDWSDKLAATFAGMASLGASVAGPTGREVRPSQLLVERSDCFFLIQYAGQAVSFPNAPGRDRRVDTILGIVAGPDADLEAVGFEMTHLIERFAPLFAIEARVSADHTTR